MSNKNHLRVVYDDDAYQAVRRRVKRWAEGKGRGHKYLEYVLLAPDMLHLLGKLVMDKRVPFRSKVSLGMAITYFVSPLDLLPEAVFGPIGYLDDIVVAAWAIDDLISATGPEVVREHWAGDEDVLLTIAKISAATNEMLGTGLVRRLQEAFRSQRTSLGGPGAAHKLPAGK